MVHQVDAISIHHLLLVMVQMVKQVEPQVTGERMDREPHHRQPRFIQEMVVLVESQEEQSQEQEQDLVQVAETMLYCPVAH